jgi:hypothetical protein
MIILGGIFLLILISIKPALGATITWHSTVKEGATWKWKVTEYSGDVENQLNVLGNFEEGMIIEVRAVGNPPVVGTWATLVSTSDIAWADYHINGTKSNVSEGIVYFFVAPLDIGNTSYGWEAWVNTIKGFVIFWYVFGSGDTFNDEIYNTSSNTLTYEINASGTDWLVDHELKYNNETGVLQEYAYTFSNSTLSSSVIITRDTGGLLGDIPGFEFLPLVLGLGSLILLPMMRKRSN